MQSKTSSAQAQVVRVGKGCLAAVAGMAAFSPQIAYALTVEDAWQQMTSSPVPLACAGVGFVVGAGLVGVVSSGVHKAKIASIEERLQTMEERLSQLDAQGSAEKSPDVQLKHAKHVARNGEPSVTFSQSALKDAVEQESEAEAELEPEHEPLPEADAEVEADAHFERLSHEDKTHMMPVIERGAFLGNTGSTGALDRTHATEVMKRLDGGTKSRMIERRIPSLDALILREIPIPEEENDFTDPELFDPEAYVDKIMREEIQHREDEAARRFTRANLTVFEGAGASADARQADEEPGGKTPTQRYVAAWSREA